MINDFWNLVVETWEQGIRGIGIDNLIICLLDSHWLFDRQISYEYLSSR